VILPGPSAATESFWAAAREHRLALPRCGACGTWLHPQSPGCPCGASDAEWVPASGRASLVSFAVVRRAPHTVLADTVPYTLLLVALAEGPQMVSSLAGGHHSLSVGQQLQVWFDDVTDDVTLPRFAPLPDAPGSDDEWRAETER
jgi:uncharacterized OB-fold protein